jgi:N-acetylglucosamine-6-phosphate deacetylase
MPRTGDKAMIIEGIHYKTSKPIRLGVSDGKIDSISIIRSRFTDHIPVIAPGLVDLQINGYKGIDFNSPELTPDKVEKLSSGLLRTGVTSYLPTLITSPPEHILRQLEVIGETAGLPVSSAMIKGIHLEGPFISTEDGPRGVHLKKFCLLPDIDLVKKWQEAARGRIKLITLAPELPGSPELITACIQMGMTVAIGHTAAKAEQIREAVDRGARLSTHLGNGAHNIIPRHPNYIWEQLAEKRLYASIIADGFHLPDSVLKVFMEVKKEKAILISDGMSFTGMKPGRYKSLQTGSVVLCSNGRLHLEGKKETLAGSARTLLQDVLKTMMLESCGLAWDMASLHPAELLGLDNRKGLGVDAPADLVIFEKNEDMISIQQVIIHGRAFTMSLNS